MADSFPSLMLHCRLTSDGSARPRHRKYLYKNHMSITNTFKLTYSFIRLPKLSTCNFSQDWHQCCWSLFRSGPSFVSELPECIVSSLSMPLPPLVLNNVQKWLSLMSSGDIASYLGTKEGLEWNRDQQHSQVLRKKSCVRKKGFWWLRELCTIQLFSYCVVMLFWLLPYDRWLAAFHQLLFYRAQTSHRSVKNSLFW